MSRLAQKSLKIICKFKKTPYLCNPNREVRGYIAEIAQLVERNLAKVEVAGPSPVFRSKDERQSLVAVVRRLYR